MNNSALNFSTWFLSSSFYAFQMVLRLLPLLMIDYLSRRLGMGAAELGTLAGIYYLGYCLAHIPIGIALDKYRPKYVIIASIVLCILGIYLMAYASSIYEVYISRFIIGAGSVAGFLGSAKVTGDFYPNRFGLMLGLSISIGFVGALYGAEPVSIILTTLSPEQAMQAMALFAMILIACIWAAYKAKSKTEDEKKDYDSTILLKRVITNKNLWILGLLGGLLVGPLEGFAGIWGIKFLKQVYGMRDSQANYCINLILIGAAIGFPLFGFLAKYVNLRKLAMFLGISNLLILVLLFSDIRLEISTIFCICFLIGLFTTHEICIFTNLARKAEQDIISLSRALVNMVIMSFGFIYNVVIGFVLNNLFKSTSFSELVFTAEAYRYAFGIMILGIIVGIFGFYKAKVFD